MMYDTAERTICNVKKQVLHRQNLCVDEDITLKSNLTITIKYLLILQLFFFCNIIIRTI